MHPVLLAVVRCLAGRRVAALTSIFLFFAPVSAFAGEGGVHAKLEKGDYGFLIFALVAGLLSIGIGLGVRSGVLAHSAGSDRMQDVGKAIRDGAHAYLRKQMGTMAIFVMVLAMGLFALFWKSEGPMLALGTAICFVAGVAASYSAGFSGMMMAVEGNMRTANAATSSYRQALEVAFRSGAVTGLMTVGFGLTGVSLIFLVAGASAMKLLIGFGFGGSLAALFMRVGGGIFTKAADVGADLVGKVEAGIPEDDARNPATIADNVGDNVGDCAGMAADVFESYCVMIVATIVLGAATSELFDQHTWVRLVLSALIISGIGVIGSICGIFYVKGSEDLNADPLKLIRRGFYLATGIGIGGVGLYMACFLGGIPKLAPAIQSNALVSIDRIDRDNWEHIVDLRRSVARQQGKEPFEVAAEDFIKDPAANALAESLGVKTADVNTLLPRIQQAFNFRPEDSPPVPDLSDYRPIDFADSDDPALNYAVDSIPTTRTETSHKISLREAYGEKDDKGNFTGRQAAISVFKIKVHSLKAQGGTLPPDQTAMVGPIPDSIFKKELDDFTKTGAAQVTYSTLPATLYENHSDGKLALGVDGDFEKAYLGESRFQQQPFNYQKVSAGTAEKAMALSSPGGATHVPDTFHITLAAINHTTVPWYLFLLPVAFGIVLAFAIEQLTDYYVSTHRRPTKEVAGVAEAGAAPIIITGFSYALESSAFMVVAIVIALLLPLWIFPPSHFNGSYIPSFFGVALVGLGLLTTTGFVLAMDTFGPISDNAQGVYEMSGAGAEGGDGGAIVAKLDAAGNTTKALTKGFAITTAVIAAIALFHSYLEDSHLVHIGLRLDYPEIFLGFLIGGAAPYLFSAFSINAVGRAAFKLINEVRRQFKNDPGIMKGTSKPDYAACVAIATTAAQRELLAPGILAITLPIAVGFAFSIGKGATHLGDHYFVLSGAEALGGFLAGAILSGQLMAVLLANSGGIWDNAKKLVEEGLHGGKNTDAHMASIVADTVGDPFKDTAGPALNPLIKVMNLVALLFAPIVILPVADYIPIIVTSLCLIALALAFWLSKRGSLSDEFAHALGGASPTEAKMNE